MRYSPREKSSLISSQQVSQAHDGQHLYNAALALLFNRCFTATMSICLLSLTASYISMEQRTDIGAPTGLRYYIACTAISALINLYTLSLSLPLLRTPNVAHSQDQAQSPLRKLVRKRWTMILLDTALLGMWIAAAVVGRGSAPHFYTKGANLTALAAVMAAFQTGALGVVGLARGFREAAVGS